MVKQTGLPCLDSHVHPMAYKIYIYAWCDVFALKKKKLSLSFVLAEDESYPLRACEWPDPPPSILKNNNNNNNSYIARVLYV